MAATMVGPSKEGKISVQTLFEPTHEIMALIALRKLSLQTRMRSNPLGLHVWFLVGPFVYFHTLCVQTAKSLARFAVRLCDKYHNLTSWLILAHKVAFICVRRSRSRGSARKPSLNVGRLHVLHTKWQSVHTQQSKMGEGGLVLRVGPPDD